MNQIRFDIIDGEIKFSRHWIMTTLKYYINSSDNALTTIEISKILDEIKRFEKTLSDRYCQFLNSDTDCNFTYVNKILYEMQNQITFYIWICVENRQQVFKHLTV